MSNIGNNVYGALNPFGMTMGPLPLSIAMLPNVGI